MHRSTITVQKNTNASDDGGFSARKPRKESFGQGSGWSREPRGGGGMFIVSYENCYFAVTCRHHILLVSLKFNRGFKLVLKILIENSESLFRKFKDKKKRKLHWLLSPSNWNWPVEAVIDEIKPI